MSSAKCQLGDSNITELKWCSCICVRIVSKLSVITTRYFQDKLDDSAHKILTDYQTATVTLLALISAASGDVSRHFAFFLSDSRVRSYVLITIDP